MPDRVTAHWPADRLVPGVGDRPPAVALDETLRGIAVRYGEPTASIVAMQLEYPRAAAAGARWYVDHRD